MRSPKKYWTEKILEVINTSQMPCDFEQKHFNKYSINL